MLLANSCSDLPVLLEAGLLRVFGVEALAQVLAGRAGRARRSTLRRGVRVRGRRRRAQDAVARARRLFIVRGSPSVTPIAVAANPGRMHRLLQCACNHRQAEASRERRPLPGAEVLVQTQDPTRAGPLPTHEARPLALAVEDDLLGSRHRRRSWSNAAAMAPPPREAKGGPSFPTRTSGEKSAHGMAATLWLSSTLDSASISPRKTRRAAVRRRRLRR